MAEQVYDPMHCSWPLSLKHRVSGTSIILIYPTVFKSAGCNLKESWPLSMADRGTYTGGLFRWLMFRVYNFILVESSERRTKMSGNICSGSSRSNFRSLQK